MIFLIFFWLRNSLSVVAKIQQVFNQCLNTSLKWSKNFKMEVIHWYKNSIRKYIKMWRILKEKLLRIKIIISIAHRAKESKMMILILLRKRKRLFLRLFRIKHNSRSKKNNSSKMMDGLLSRKNDFYLLSTSNSFLIVLDLNKRQNKNYHIRGSSPTIH